MKLGELKKNDIFYLINWEGNYIDSIEKCKVQDIHEINIGRQIYYIKENNEYKDIFKVIIESSEYEEKIAIAYSYISICSDKEALIVLLNKNKDDFINSYNKILKNI